MLAKSKINKSLNSIYLSPQPTIALLNWGDVWEDFFGSIGVSFDSFCNEFTGSWLFGYIEALKLAGVKTVIFYTSSTIDQVLRFTHAPTGATVCMLPVPKSYKAIRRHMIHPHPSLAYYGGAKDLFGDAQGVRRYLFKVLRCVAPYLATPLGLLAEEIRREGCSVILCQDYEHSRFDISVVLGKRLGLPVFASFQGGTSDWNRIGRFARPLTIKACTGLVIGTKIEIQRIREHYKLPGQSIAQIFNPVDVKLWNNVNRDEARAMFDLPLCSQVVVWHGRIDIRPKGLDILLETWEKVCSEREGRDMRLLLLGTGPDAKVLYQQIANLAIQNVIWIDKFVNDRAFIRDFLSTGDVYAFSSRHEGFPVAPIEAMACGLPVVATSAPGIPDILAGGERSGGIVVPCDDINVFSQALGRVLDDETLARELGDRARQRIEKHFSLESVGEQLRNFLLKSTCNVEF